MAKTPLEPCVGVGAGDFSVSEDFKMQTFLYSTCGNKGGYAKKKIIFRAKKSPQTLDVRVNAVQLGLKSEGATL